MIVASTPSALKSTRSTADREAPLSPLCQPWGICMHGHLALMQQAPSAADGCGVNLREPDAVCRA